MRFLIVDNDFETRSHVQKILRPFGSVDIAIDGEEAIEAVFYSLKENDPYCLITMAIFMPNISGHQALREIRQIEREFAVHESERVSIIMLSGMHDTDKLHEAFFLGDASSFIIKPINDVILLQEVAKLGLAPAV